mgnify:CR=1 FL=1
MLGFVQERSDHADAVLYLRQVLIGRQWREWQTCLDVEFIGRVHQTGADPLLEPAGKRLNGCDDPQRLAWFERSQRKQPFPMSGDPDGNHGDGKHRREQARNIVDRLQQMPAVIYPGRQNDLRMHSDAAGGKPLHACHDIRGVLVPHEKRSQSRFGGVDRYIQRAEPLGKDPFPVVLTKIAEGYIVPVQERGPIVVILDVQAPAAAGRHLINEAEDALVAAPSDGQGRELDAKRIVGVLDDAQPSGGAVPAGDDQGQPFFRCMEQKINAVMNFTAVYGNQPVPFLKAIPGRGAPWQNARYFQQSGAPFRGKHEIHVTVDLGLRLLRHLAIFPEHHDLLDAQDLLEVVDLFF